MRLLLDVHHPPRAADELRRRGVDAVAAAGDPLLSQLADDDLLRAAAAEGRAVVTEDVKDFPRIADELVRARKHHAGAVLTSRRRFYRGSKAYPQDLVEALVDFIESQDPPDGAVDWVRWLG